MTRPFFSVIVPTYNRPQHLGPLIDSVLAQSFRDWEVVVGEDCSPSRDKVRAIVDDYAARTGSRVRAVYNPSTFGYDKNLRTLVGEARGRFVFIMGDDDLVAPNAFAAAVDAFARHPNAGLLLRALAYFAGDRTNIVKITRYYPTEHLFPAGRKAILACYRRMVAMSGLIMDRDVAARFDTDRWDGSLFYQHWLAGNILAEKDAVYIPDLMVYFRVGSPRSFGTAAAEQELYTPGAEPPDTSLKAVQFQFRIAQAIESERGIPLMQDLVRDYANYMFPAFASQAQAPFASFYRYYRDLAKLGLGRHASFHLWFWTVAAFGARNVDRLLNAIRRLVGHTPNLTRVARPTGVA